MRTSHLVAGLLLGCGCVSSPFDRAHLSHALRERTDHALAPPRAPELGGELLPPGIALDTGLTEEDAVAIALWNNPAFLSDLATLDISRADLVTAGMIRNPLFTLLLPLGPKQLEFTALIPLEELWQRPRRVAAASGEVERVANSLTQSGLELVRDTRVAFAEVLLAQARARIGEKTLKVRREVARIAASRLRSGDISEMEAHAAWLDAQAAEVDQLQLARAVASAREGLCLRLGFGQRRLELELRPGPTARQPLALQSALKAALALRPDLRGAELAIEIAASRMGWEKTRILNSVSAVVDANGSGAQGFEAGPGVQLEVPLFNQNQGPIARAHADLERTQWRYLALRQQVEAEVRAALLDYGAAQEALKLLEGEVVAAAERNLERTQRAFAAGDVPYLAILDAARQLLELWTREATLQATVRRSAAQLDRSIGSRHANG